MMEPSKKLQVSRVLETGENVLVGYLAQNSNGAYFQYDEDYVRMYTSLSPFKLDFDTRLQRAPQQPHEGLHGLFADSLPDGWGMLLMGRVFRRAGISLKKVSQLDRLAFIHDRAIGALRYEPVSPHGIDEAEMPSLFELGSQAQTVFEGGAADILDILTTTGSSGGARPKALVFFDGDNMKRVSTQAQDGFDPWLVKFTSTQLSLGHEEGLCEASYLQMARQVGIQSVEWRLLNANGQPSGTQWLALKRFDCTSVGRYHVHSLCGLLDADFRLPSTDYESLLRVTSLLCNDNRAVQQQFRRAIFNLFAVNQDDHTKNWSFLQDDQGSWSPAPFYDVTFAPTPFGEHSMSYAGYGKCPPKKAIESLGTIAGFSTWRSVRSLVQEVVEVLAQWPSIASANGVSQSTIGMIEKQLAFVRNENKELFI